VRLLVLSWINPPNRLVRYPALTGSPSSAANFPEQSGNEKVGSLFVKVRLVFLTVSGHEKRQLTEDLLYCNTSL
ncbi:MAG TPA: hypothetical protein VNQ57_04910, partial [Ureibacillus sp.]|nr:hypothetical protein [Ureibacillus sp.]